jgi:hypothetical protein
MGTCVGSRMTSKDTEGLDSTHLIVLVLEVPGRIRASAYLHDLLKPYSGREWCEVAISKALGATTPNRSWPKGS